jgi:two-component system, OmpR family, sensor histidine kinase MprB
VTEPPRGATAQRFGPTLTLRGRVALLAAVAVALSVAAAAVAAYFVVSAQVRHQFDDDLAGRARALGGALSNPDQAVQIPADLLGPVDVGLLTATGTLYVPRGGDPPPVGPAEQAVADGASGGSIRDAQQGGQDVRVVAVPAGVGRAIVLSQSTTSTDHTLRVLTLVLALVGAVGVVVAAVAGLLVARAGLRPVERLTSAAEDIARTERLTPLPVQGTDELARLTTAFNTMLVALDRSRSRQAQLVADAGHELRTPLTSLRTNLDLLAQSDSAPPEGKLDAVDRTALVDDVRAQVEELGVLVGDLVELSRDDDSQAESTVTFDLTEVVDRAVERVRRRAPRVTFDVRTEPWEVVGRPEALERAVTNLLDNAAKWSPPTGTVWVELRAGTLSVADQGPGIAEADLPHIFDRFYRSAEARSKPGSGLGLAIVAQTVTRHGGTVEAARAAGGGALMTVSLPGRPPARPATPTAVS